MADCFIPLRFNSSKLILVGDPRQLPPTVKSDVARKYGLNQSLYDRLYATLKGSSSITTLMVQYRMHREICSFPNRLFYEGVLRTDSSIDKRMQNFGLKPLYYYNRNGFGETRNNYGGIQNEEEAICVVHLCCQLIKHLELCRKKGDCRSDVQKRILIISPYRSQVHLIKQLLEEEDLFNVDVITVDGVQGQENDFVIFSCVRSGNNIGFLKDERRLNVALTRAKQALYIIGNLRKISERNRLWKQLVMDAERRNIIFNVQNGRPRLQFS